MNQSKDNYRKSSFHVGHLDNPQQSPFAAQHSSHTVHNKPNLKTARSFDYPTLSINCPSQSLRPSTTVPSTPSVPRHVVSPRKKQSVNRLNIRSQVFKRQHSQRNLTHSQLLDQDQSDIDVDDDNDELTSLRTSKASNSIISNIRNGLLDPIQSSRNYYNDFTTIDWAKAYLKGNQFNYSLEKNEWIGYGKTNDLDNYTDHKQISFLQKQYYILGKWILIVLVGLFFSLIAFMIDKVEILLVGFKYGYCKSNWFASQVSCCAGVVQNNKTVFHSASVDDPQCPNWISWSQLFHNLYFWNIIRWDFIIYVALTIVLAVAACVVTLKTKITTGIEKEETSTELTYKPHLEVPQTQIKQRVLYTAMGSGVPEVKIILSGFVIRRFLGVYTLFTKSVALVLAIASGMSLGKEGPYVHLATCVGNIMSRYFPFIYTNDFFEKQILSASASAGVALAFGSPLGGVLFILEEINNHLPNHQLFQVFFCAIISTLFLKVWDPYGTGKTVLFELEYYSDWKPIESVLFVVLGVAGGVFGACFVKFINWWPKVFRKHSIIKQNPIFEVGLIALVTGLVTFWNPYTKQASSELVLDLATSCSGRELDRSLCPTTGREYLHEIRSLSFAFFVKIALTFVTFGMKVPCGIYVPSMVVGALFGRIFAMAIQWISIGVENGDENLSGGVMAYMFGSFACGQNSSSGSCIDLGIYAMISAGAFMAGVTRMNITIVVIMFELTSSYTYVLPIAIAISVANWSGSLLEKNSLYESVLINNDYPFMASDSEPVDPRVRVIDIIDDGLAFAPDKYNSDTNDKGNNIYIDLTDSNYVSFTVLEEKLCILANHSLLDGGIPIIKNRKCKGLIYFADLEICLDRINAYLDECGVTQREIGDIYCKLLHGPTTTVHQPIIDEGNDYFTYGSAASLDDPSALDELTDLTPYVDIHPLFISEESQLSFASLIFERIGNRVIVLLNTEDGACCGVLHKKILVDYLRRCESNGK
ncbi:hypothetical protein CANMA_001619 [Candida margitis]|uniref:uncharacterized protein n=1 Tax=Candida margitis TaxID=1775924 RepID=UPI0022268E61|nr:uncharacterized protein CANMA_001619 [Candida margitis]KAI5969299.1 hypothetical protein CANMA_001619 [Candida margitis]